MELLLQAIEKKLSHVDSERSRWMQYKDEHEQASNNLREFQKSFHKEILVPIGSKALMPGHLYHTNEIFVGMYAGLFVKCSADKALNVCEHRLGEANKRIDALNVEHKMYKDRLELPVDEHVFSSIDGAQEIIEEYNEEEEAKWREKHKISMREYKKSEAEERKNQQNDDIIDINAILEEAELMEDLENELEMLDVNDYEQMQQHLQSSSEQMDMNEHVKSNVKSQLLNVNDAQPKECTDANDTDGDNEEMGSKEFLALGAATIGLSIEDKIKFYEIHLKKTKEYFETNHCTIHNFDEFTDKRVTEECLQNAIEELQESLNDNTTETSIKPITSNEMADAGQENNNTCKPKFHTQQDFDRIEREYAMQNKSKSELVIFYKSQLRNVMKSIAGCTLDLHSRDEKRRLYEFLSDRISSLREEIQKEKQIKLEEDFVDDDDIDKNMKQLGRNFESSNSNNFELDDFKADEVTGKRKISFASQPITVTFFEDDEPCAVSQENINNLMDSTFQFFNSPSSSSNSSICGDDEENANASNKQHPMNNTNDCDMGMIENYHHVVSNTMPNQNKPTTLILQFNHSDNLCTASVSTDDETINSPLDIYKQFDVHIESSNRPLISPTVDCNRTSSQNVPQIQNKFNTNQLTSSRATEADVEKAKKMLDQMENWTSNVPLEVPNINAKPTKSILKNSSSVRNESRAPATFDQNPMELGDQWDSNEAPDELPAFTQVLGDIVERKAVNGAQISAQLNDIQTGYTTTNDASTNNQPKKRVSLFKKSRMS